MPPTVKINPHPRKPDPTRRGRRESIAVALWLTAALLLGGCATPLPPPEATSAWRVGPLVERARTAPGDSLFALRPLVSHEYADTEKTEVFDLLWPFGTYHRGNDRWRWRLLLAYGLGDDEGGEDEAYRLRLFPLYFSGRTRQGGQYRALFPIYGEVRDFLWMGDTFFFLFPFYGKAENHGTTTTTYLWPFYLRRQGPKIEQLRLWPLYGKRRDKGWNANVHSFVLWPIWSHVDIENEAVEGSGFILFPLYGRSRYESRRYGTESGYTILPPFFGITRNESGYRSLKAPWPFIRQLDDGTRRERHWWPLYGTVEDTGRQRWYALWPFVTRNRWQAKSHTAENFSVLPFYYQYSTAPTNAADSATTPTGTAARSSYRRLWPLFSWQRQDQASRLRIPELTLFHNSQAIERNWAPLWSLFVRQKRGDGAYVTDILWGLAAWGRDADQKRFMQLFWVLNFRASGDQPTERDNDDSP